MIGVHTGADNPASTCMWTADGDNDRYRHHRDAAMAESIDALHERYRASLADKAGELEALWPLPTSTPARERIAPLRQLLHKLAGSAGSYGYAEIGSQARLLEQWLSAWGSGGPRPGERPPLRMSQAFLELIDRLRRTAAGNG